MNIKIPVYSPRLSGKEKEYVDECLDTTWISSKGKFVALFEKGFAEYLGVKYATAVSNGTVALHLAMVTLGIHDGDEVIVPTFTYIASANAIHYVGAKPIFCDSLKETWQMDPEDVERKITNKTKAILAVHLYGHPCDMKKLTEIAKKYNLYLIEDCAEAIGSEFEGKKVGTFGDISCFSFFGNKNITTGEGGMVVTNNKKLYDIASNLKTQGISLVKEYWHDAIGYNFRMTNIHAAIGFAQLELINKNLDDKRKVYNLYKKKLSNLPLDFLGEKGNVKNTFWMVSALVKDENERNRLREFLEEKGIETRPTFYNCHTMDFYKEDAKYPIADDISLRGINLPSYPDLTVDQINYICDCIKEFYEKK